MKDKEKLRNEYGTPERFTKTRQVEDQSEQAEQNISKDRRSPRPDKPVEYDKPTEDTTPGKREW